MSKLVLKRNKWIHGFFEQRNSLVVAQLLVTTKWASKKIQHLRLVLIELFHSFTASLNPQFVAGYGNFSQYYEEAVLKEVKGLNKSLFKNVEDEGEVERGGRYVRALQCRMRLDYIKPVSEQGEAESWSTTRKMLEMFNCAASLPGLIFRKAYRSRTWLDSVAVFWTMVCVCTLEFCFQSSETNATTIFLVSLLVRTDWWAQRIDWLTNHTTNRPDSFAGHLIDNW